MKWMSGVDDVNNNSNNKCLSRWMEVDKLTLSSLTHLLSRLKIMRVLSDNGKKNVMDELLTGKVSSILFVSHSNADKLVMLLFGKKVLETGAHYAVIRDLRYICCTKYGYAYVG